MQWRRRARGPAAPDDRTYTEGALAGVLNVGAGRRGLVVIFDS